MEGAPGALANRWTEDSNTVWGAYVNVIYNFTDNFYIQPEIAYRSNGEDPAGADEESTTVFGAHFQANF